jgi:PD-(D/E)XK endonuclease
MRFFECSARRHDPLVPALSSTVEPLDHGRGRLSYLGLADVFGVYFPPRRAVYLVPVHEVPNFIVSLRLKPARNNQRRGIRLARDYEIERWSTERLCELARAANRPLATQLRAVG